MNATDEALRRLRAASRCAPGTVAERRAAVVDAWASLRATTRDAAPPARSRSRSGSGSRERRRKRKRRGREGSAGARRAGKSDDNEALFAAARSGDAAAVATLLAAGSRPGARDGNRCTPLHWAALFGHADVAAALLAAGGPRLARKHAASSRATPLHYAARCGHGDVAAALLAAGADEFAADAAGDTPVSLGLRRLQAAAATDARLQQLQAARDAARAGAGALASAAWEAAQAGGASVPTPAAAQTQPRVAPAAQWAAYQAAWPAFEARASSRSGGEGLEASDVPWPFLGCWAADGAHLPLPPGSARRLLLAAMPLAGPALRQAVREERRRWHPDRLGRLLAALAPAADAAAAQEMAGGIIRELNALADALAADAAAD